MKSIILFGFKSCGKTHFGKLLAKKLWWPFIDTDDLMLNSSFEKYSSIRSMHQALGEKEFRELETNVICELQPLMPSVIALGGGSPLNPKTLNHLQSTGHLIYLKANLSTIQTRIFKGTLPSFIDPKDPERSLFILYQQRKAVYEKIAKAQVQVDLLEEKQVLDILHSMAAQKEALSYYGF